MLCFQQISLLSPGSPSVALQTGGTGSAFTPEGESISWQLQRWMDQSFTATGGLFWVCCSPKPPWARDFSVTSARRASQLYPEVFHHLRWFLELPALLLHSWQLCWDMSGLQDPSVRWGEIRSQPTPHLTVLPGCQLCQGNTRFGEATPGTCPPQPPACPYPQPWCLQGSFRSCGHPARLEAAVEQLRACQLSAQEGFVILGAAVLLPGVS